MTNRMLAVCAAIVIVAGLAFITDNYFYIYKHPATPPQSAASANAAPASAHGTPPMPRDPQQAAVYKELEDRLKAIRHTQ